MKLQFIEKDRLVARRIAARLTALDLPGVFNPYRDVCALHDAAPAPEIRKANLIAYLEGAFGREPRTAWIGRDLGWRGGRRTGLPLTDEVHLHDMQLHFEARPLRKATKTPALAERTAAEIWRLIGDLKHPPFLWNAFPLHPFGDDALGNRRHSRAEFDAVADVLETLLEEFAFRRIFALGADASSALTRLGVAHERIRHPSFGGHVEFRLRMRQEYADWNLLV